MTTETRREQNIPEVNLPEDIDAILERQIKSEKSRQEYQKRPEVQEKRKKYQAQQQFNQKMARAAMKGNVSALLELGLTQEQADAAVATAAKVLAT